MGSSASATPPLHCPLVKILKENKIMFSFVTNKNKNYTLLVTLPLKFLPTIFVSLL